MENAVDALKMAASVLVFVVALSVAIFAFTKAKQAATAVLSESDLEYYNTDNIKVTENRIVGIETIIPTLYSYYKEGYTVLFYDGRNAFDSSTQELRNGDTITPLTLYYSEALPSKLVLSKLLSTIDKRNEVTYNGANYSRAIYGFDIDDEDTRQEPWLSDEFHAKEFMKSFINNFSGDLAPKYDMSRASFSGSPTNRKSNNKLEMNFNIRESNSLLDALGTSVPSLSMATDARFIERIGTYNETSEEYRDDENNLYVNSSIDSSVITFSNGETIQNEEGVQKRVIQYIFIGNK